MLQEPPERYNSNATQKITRTKILQEPEFQTQQINEFYNTNAAHKITPTRTEFVIEKYVKASFAAQEGVHETWENPKLNLCHYQSPWFPIGANWDFTVGH